LDGFESKIVSVEATLTKGLPSFTIVGLPDNSIKESKERVKSALLTNGFSFPPMRVTLNLSPSDIKKEGSHFDLSIASLIGAKNIRTDREFFVFGELGLEGRVKDTALIYPLVLSFYSQTTTSVIIPKDSIDKIKRIPNLEIFGVEHLKECVDFLEGNLEIEPILTEGISEDFIEIDKKRYFYTQDYTLDFKDVKGQELAKRGALIAAAGFHNILFEGSPGCGKSMIVKRLSEILPPLSIEELLEGSKLESLEGKEPTFIPKRPFRAPHHSSTKASIFGGGTKEAKIGEVALSNYGVLFFDELPHFGKNILESLREPLEDNQIRVSRVNSKVLYKTEFLFAGALNPCPCGNLLSNKNSCRCNEFEIKRYKNRLSDPFLDRIDLFLQMGDADLKNGSTVSSKELHEKVLKAFEAQKNRGQKHLNGKLSESEVVEFCALERGDRDLLMDGANRLGISHRGINKILKVSRTIADLDNSEQIKRSHLLEAISFRRR